MISSPLLAGNRNVRLAPRKPWQWEPHSKSPMGLCSARNIRLKATATAGPTAVELFNWLEDNGAHGLNVDVQTVEVGGRSIDRTVAKRDLEAGDIALSIPDDIVVTLDGVFQDESLAELLTTNKLSELACLTLYMMYEKKEGSKSFWFPYIKELDKQRGRGPQGAESPILWPKEEVEELFAGSPLLGELQTRIQGIKDEYQECDTVWYLAGSLFDKYPYDIPTEAFSEELFKQAFTAIQACVVHLQGVALSKRFALLPLGPPLTSYSSTSKAMLKYNPNTKTVDLVADKSYAAGEPIVAWCGPQTNTRLLINYGIVDENNPYDWVQVMATIPSTDPLFTQKRAILLENGLATKQSFRLQRGKPLPPVLSYMRLAYETDPKALSKIGFNKDAKAAEKSVEKQILEHLASTLYTMLSNYRTTIDQDIQTIQSSTNPREVVAAKLVKIEKEILTGALDEILADPLAPEKSSLQRCGVITSPVRLA